jgi:hypothetical protein
MGHLLLTIGAIVLLIGCDFHMNLHPHAEYLQQSVGREDHDAIAKKMGAPNRTITLDKGGDLWTYDYCPQGSLPGSIQCQHLNLVFDKSGKLAEWHDKQ